jgi:fructose/tagatose bisphosphate aldolase
MMLTENSALLHSMFFVNAEQINGVFGGAEAAGMPVIVQITPASRNSINYKFIEGMIKAVENIYSSVNYSVINQIKRK